MTVSFLAGIEREYNSILWDFGDTITSSEKNPEHTFETNGIYYVTLVVTYTDDSLYCDMIPIVVEIVPNNPPTASVSASSTSGVVPMTIDFYGLGTDDDGSIESYYWEFGDGYSSSQKNPTHVYQDSGTFSVILTVTDNENASDSDTIIIIISEKTYDDIEFYYWSISDSDNYIYYCQEIAEECGKGLSCNEFILDLYSGYRQEWTEKKQSEISNFDLSSGYEKIREEYNEFLDDQWLTDNYLQEACDCISDYDYSGAIDYLELSKKYQNKATAHLNKCTDMLKDLIN